MNELRLGQTVRICRTGETATVIGIWWSLFGEPQYLCRYSDATRRLAEHWLTVGELATIGESPAAGQ
jgi:hypothetical protein